jgi:hypothetical protein
MLGNPGKSTDLRFGSGILLNPSSTDRETRKPENPPPSNSTSKSYIPGQCIEISHTMQGSGRLLTSSARHTVLRLSQHSRTSSIRTIYSRPPPPSFVVSSSGVQQRGYRRSAVTLKEDDEKPKKTGKDVEKQKDDSEKKSVAKDEAFESAKDPESGEAESTGVKEKRTKREKHVEESVRPAVISRNQALSLVANNGNKSRLIITNHDHPETYPQCMALAMSGRPILPGFYSTLLSYMY